MKPVLACNLKRIIMHALESRQETLELALALAAVWQRLVRLLPLSTWKRKSLCCSVPYAYEYCFKQGVFLPHCHAV